MASKNFTVILSKAAERELVSIFRYVALNKENPIAAKRFIHALEKRLIGLKNQPESYAVYEPCQDFHIIHFGR